MTFMEAVQQGLLRKGIKRPGWTGYITAIFNGQIVFMDVKATPRHTTPWTPYEQDIVADDWEPA